MLPPKPHSISRKPILLTAQAQLDQARRQLELANHNLDRSKLLAPFSGTIARVEVKSFAQVAAGQPIVTLYSDDRFETSFLVPAATFQSLTAWPAGRSEGRRPARICRSKATSRSSDRRPSRYRRSRSSSGWKTVSPGLNAGMSVEVAIEEPLIGGGNGFLLPLSVLAPEGEQGCCRVSPRCSFMTMPPRRSKSARSPSAASAAMTWSSPAVSKPAISLPQPAYPIWSMARR